jgi:PDZ domain-containing protein
VDHGANQAPLATVAGEETAVLDPGQPAAQLRGAAGEPVGIAHRPRLRLGQKLALAAAALVVCAVLASGVVRLPYYTLGPGQVRPTAPLVTVEGGERFDPEGQIAFATVSVRGRITVWEAIWAGFSDELDVVEEDVVNQGRSEEETEAANRRLMDESKTVSVSVALDALGLAEDAGAQVVEVVDDSPAGPVLDPGQVIVEIDGTTILTSNDLVEAVVARKPGDRIRLVVADQPAVTGGAPSENRREVELTLAANPERNDAGFLGIRVQTYRSSNYDGNISIDSGPVGGPSAGLAFSLGLMDVLTEGELTGGGLVAATGSVDSSGTVGPIGGLVHKVDAAKAAGAKLFLVPSAQTPEELDEARRRAGDGLMIVPVASVDEALAVLAESGGDGLPDGVPR